MTLDAQTWQRADALGKSVRDEWFLDPNVVFLNHGSFGASPRLILAAQSRLREQLERQPLDFLVRDLEERLDVARVSVTSVIGGSADALGFVTNATTAVNAVVWSLDLQPGDEIIVTDHVYNACHNAVQRVADRCGAHVVVAELPLPCEDEGQIIAAIASKITARTVFGLIDQIASMSALVLPVGAICQLFEKRGVPVMIDAAHVPGQLPVDVDELGATWWTGNLHKWCCTPKGSAVLHAREDVRDGTMPAITSHAHNSERSGRSRYLQAFDWQGTWDPTAVLSIPASLAFLGGLLPGGLPALMQRNRDLCLAAAQLLHNQAGLEPVVAASMRGSMCAFGLRPGPRIATSRCEFVSPLQDLLHRRFGIEVPVIPAPGGGDGMLLRISCYAYNDLADYAALAAAVNELRREGFIR